MGKILNVDLFAMQLHDEVLDEQLYRKFFGRYGIGAELLYDRMPAKVDPLGPESLLGFFTGPLTGSPSIEGNRFVVVCKSPLTNTWGDANCGGHMSVKEPGPYQGVAHHKVEYETAASWGTMTLMDDFPALIKINELCNRLGFDTIGAGCTAAFAVECYENGLITKEDTGGLELNWGNGDALVALVEKMAYREGIGDILADGLQRAAGSIGKGAEQYTIHVHGSEVPMHDPKFQPGLATTYVMDATPARHTQGHEDMPPFYEG